MMENTMLSVWRIITQKIFTGFKCMYAIMTWEALMIAGSGSGETRKL